MQVVVDSRGRKTSVIVPFSKWEKLNCDFEKFQSILNVLTGIAEGLNEIELAKCSGRKLKTLAQVLH